MRSIYYLIIGTVLGILVPNLQASQSEYVVYSIHQGLNLGNPGEHVPKDYYINIGAQQGLRVGSVLDVLRRVSSFDGVNQEFYRDVVFPIAKIRVIHADLGVAICRLEKILPVESTPTISPRSIMVGDLVKPAVENRN